MTPEFHVPIRELDAAGKEFVFPVRAEWIRGALEDSEATAAGPDGVFDVRLSKSGNDVVVHGRLTAELEVPCARCLKPARIRVAEPVTALMVPAATIKQPGKEHELTSDEADVVPYEGDTIVLDGLVRDELVLGIPMIPLCSSDCAGISPGPQAAKAKAEGEVVDPRLAPLKKYRLNKE